MAKLFRIVDLQVLDGQQLMNRYFYDAISDDVTSEQVADAWTLQILPYVQNIQNEEAVHTSIVVEEILAGKDKYVNYIVSGAGSQSGSFVTSFNSYGFHLFPASGNFRAGAKRYAGVSENDINNGTTDSTFNLALNALAVKLADEIVVNIGLDIITPVLAREVNAGTQYLLSPIIQAARGVLTTQNSRKANKGGGSFTFAAVNKTLTQTANGIFTELSVPGWMTTQANATVWTEITRNKE